MSLKLDKSLSGAKLIELERNRQINEEGFDDYHDMDSHQGQLVWAALGYASPEIVYRLEDSGANKEELTFVEVFPSCWNNWDKRRRHPGTGNLVKKRRTRDEVLIDLIKAGALIAAEIDRRIYEEQHEITY